MRSSLRLCLFASLFLVLPAQAQDGFVVETLQPVQNALTAGGEAEIVVTFSAAVDPATVDWTTFMVFGRWSGGVPGTYAFEQNDTQIRFTPDRPYLAGEMVTVSLSRSITAADGTAMPHAFTWQFWVEATPGTLDLQFTEKLDVRRPGESRIQTYGAFAGDLNADGYTDFAVPNEFSKDVRVFMNDGTGGYSDFEIYPLPNGDLPSTNDAADFDLDGDMDFAVGSRGNDNVSVFMGDGTGTLLGPDSYETDTGVRGLSVLDLDGDGYMDIATANREYGGTRRDRLGRRRH